MQFLYIVFAWLTRLIFTLVSQVLLLIDNLSKYNFFSVKTVNEFTTKVYVIVGVLMLFKLVISAIQYIINPDNFSDKNKGLGSILTKSVIVVVLLAVVPTLFDFALDVQNTIVDAIPNVIFGNDTTSTNNNFDNVGEQISVSILSGFLSPKSGKTPTVPFNTVDDFEAVATDGCNASIISNEFLYGTRCVYDFWWVLAFPVGIFLVVVLIAMAADVGIRTIKFGIVQILAPIPIVSYITDEKKFNNWVTTSLQIYADLFIRMAVIYFVIYFIKVILQDFLTTTGYPQEFASAINRTPQPMEIVFVKVFIVIALIMFAKNAPKFITDLLGIKGVDDSITNMFKRAGGIFGAGLGGLKTARSNYTTQKESAAGKGLGKGRQVAEGLRSAIAGMGSATARGMLMAGQGKGFKDTRQEAFKKAIKARDNRNDRLDNLYNKDASSGEKYNYWDYRRDVKRQKLGIPNTASYYEGVNKNLSDIRSSIDSEVGHGLKKLEDYKDRDFVSTSSKGFGTVMSLDEYGNAINSKVTTMSLATARSRANAEIGSYYVDDEGMVQTRRTNLLNKQHNEVERLNNDLTILSNERNNAVASGQPSAVIDGYDRRIANLRNLYNESLQKESEMRKDENLGKIQVTDKLRGQWDTVVHSLEKQARFQLESSLLSEGDVDAVVGLEKTIGLLKNNATLDNDDIVKSVFSSLSANGSKFGSLDELMSALNNQITTSKGTKGYSVDAETIETAKMIAEELVKATNERAQINAERAKRTSKAIENDSKK